MDPSIVKLLEDDEDETMHSGADVEAFQAALNRDIGGDACTSSQPSESDAAVSHGDLNSSIQPLPHIQASIQHENTNHPIQHEQHSSQMKLEQQASVSEHQQQHDGTHLQAPQKQPQDDRQQVPSQMPQTTGLPVSDRNQVLMNEPERVHNRGNETQYMKLQKMSNQQAMVSEQASSQMTRGKQVPFALLLPVLLPQLDKDRAMQLQTLFSKLKKNEMNKDDFVKHMRTLVGDHMLRVAVTKVQSQSPPALRQMSPRMPSVSGGPTNFTDPRSFAQLHQKGVNSPVVPSQMPSSVSQVKTDSNYLAMDNSSQSAREAERQPDSSGTSSGLEKQQPQLLFQQKPLAMYGTSGSNNHPYSGTNMNTSTSSLKPQPHETPIRSITQQQSMGSSPLVGDVSGINMMNSPSFERKPSINDPKRVQSGSLPHFSSNLTSQQNSVPWKSNASRDHNSGPYSSMPYVKQEPTDQVTEQQKNQQPSSHGLPTISNFEAEQGNMTSVSSKDEALELHSSKLGFPASTSLVSSNLVPQKTTAQLDHNAMLGCRNPTLTAATAMNRTPPKKPLTGQKKPLEAVGGSPPLPSKKQKVGGAFSEQSIDLLNDVTAVSGVNLREEEEQLFSSGKEDSRLSEASRRFVHEEEERLILQKNPLQKKLAEIMAKCGLKSLSNDVEKCLSLCVEERMRGLISNLIRLSKQRVDSEKPRHRTVLTSDVRHQIMLMNRKAREEWDKKQAEVERHRRLNEPEDANGVSGDKEKDEGRSKAVKVNKEDDDKMRTTAANVAARAAVGGDDMLSKWQLMAEQARQKREGGMDSASGSQPSKDAMRKPSSASGKNVKDNQEAEKKGSNGTPGLSGASRKFGRSQAVASSQARVARSISVRDVIAVLEREPQMSKSTMIYRLYEKIRSEAASE